jgi:hypothetical protein
MQFVAHLQRNWAKETMAAKEQAFIKSFWKMAQRTN